MTESKTFLRCRCGETFGIQLDKPRGEWACALATFLEAQEHRLVSHGRPDPAPGCEERSGTAGSPPGPESRGWTTTRPTEPGWYAYRYQDPQARGGDVMLRVVFIDRRPDHTLAAWELWELRGPVCLSSYPSTVAWRGPLDLEAL